MGDNILNGTVVTWAIPTVNKVRSVRATVGGEEIDITGLSDSSEVYDLGLDDLEVELEVVGNTTLSRGDSEDLLITWPDETTFSMTDALITSVEEGGSLNGEIVSTIRIRQGEA